MLLAAFGINAVPSFVHATTITDFELKGVVEIYAYNDDEEWYVSGTGFTDSYSAKCVVTATHVITDDDDIPYENIYVIFDAGTEEEMMYEATPIVAYTDVDIAFLCITDETFPEQFRHFFPLDVDAFAEVETGDSVTALGYPTSSSDTITASFGQVTGFDPWFEERDILKTDVPVAGGVSGAPALSEDKTILGMFIGYDEDTGGGLQTTYAVSADLLNYIGEIAGEALLNTIQEADESPIPEGCSYDQDEGLFSMDGEWYYNLECSRMVDESLEEMIATQYEYWCNEEAHEQYVASAVYTLSDDESLLSIDDWREYLNGLCGELDESDIYNYATPEQTLGARLIKSAEFPAVYAVLADGKRHAFPTQAVYESWYGEDFSEIETVSSEELSSYTIGTNITFQPGSLIKIPSIAKVYMVSDEQELRWMVDEDTALALYGSEWAQSVHDVSEAFFMNYTGVGEEIQL